MFFTLGIGHYKPTRHNSRRTRGFLFKTRGDLAEFTWFVLVGGGVWGRGGNLYTMEVNFIHVITPSDGGGLRMHTLSDGGGGHTENSDRYCTTYNISTPRNN